MIDRYDPRVSIEGEGRPLVLVPGLNGTGELFYRQAPSLRHVFRVATYSLRDDAPTLNVLMDDLARVIEQVAPADRRAIVDWYDAQTVYCLFESERHRLDGCRAVEAPRVIACAPVAINRQNSRGFPEIRAASA